MVDGTPHLTQLSNHVRRPSGKLLETRGIDCGVSHHYRDIHWRTTDMTACFYRWMKYHCEVTNKPLGFRSDFWLPERHLPTLTPRMPLKHLPMMLRPSPRSPSSGSPTKTLTSDQKPRFFHPLTSPRPSRSTPSRPRPTSTSATLSTTSSASTRPSRRTLSHRKDVEICSTSFQHSTFNIFKRLRGDSTGHRMSQPSVPTAPMPQPMPRPPSPTATRPPTPGTPRP